MNAVGALPFPWALYGRRGGVASFLGPVWPPWGRGSDLGSVRLLWGVAIPWALFGGCGHVASFLGHVWLRGGMAGLLGPVWPPWGRGRSTGPLTEAVGGWPVLWGMYGHCGVWPVPWASYTRRGGVAGPMGTMAPLGV